MSKSEKRIAAIRRNTKTVRFEEACLAAESIGFCRKGGEGSHRVYAKVGESTILNFQNRQGLVAEYQVRQLIAMLNKYGDSE